MAVRFKGIELKGSLERIIPHIAVAEEYGGMLQQLQTVWDNLSLLGQLSTTGTDMTDTRRAFSELASDLLNQLGTEALKNCLQEAGCKAQVAINILVRNLFERTADIGFLSCDEDIRAFLRLPRDAADRSAAHDHLRRRFGEYVRKYSVYSDVVLLDPQGDVVVRLNDAAALAASSDPIIRDAMATSAGYVERFGDSDLFPNQKPSLIYAFRVVDEAGSVQGVLCLRFRFPNEMELIFSNLIEQDDWTVATILDDAGVVIASSDPFHVPIGVRLTPVLDCEYKIVKFGAMQYLATSRDAQPYQGYGGPKWYGHAMVPIQHAFEKREPSAFAAIEEASLRRITHASNLFSEEIRHILSKADRILRDLNRSVWNGSVSQSDTSEMGAAGFARILLKEISDTGAKTKDVFGSSIADLHQTVVTSLLHDNQLHAALAIDIMDRNLYERANDCRWWALAGIFVESLSGAEVSAQSAAAIASVLRGINSLYSVYTNLIVFDGAGTVVAVSNEADSNLIGTVLTEEWVARVLALRDAQDYAVSAFEPTSLYGDRPTYIYGAGIISPQNRKPAGGVAVVFDAQAQFDAMLKDALPRGEAGEIKHGAFALFAERDGRIIACSDEHYHPGDFLGIDEAFLSLARGVGFSNVTVIDDVFYAVGASASAGYREYKNGKDGYKNDVIALIFTELCNVEAQTSLEAVRRSSIRSDRTQNGAKEDLATVLIGERSFAVRAGEIVEAIDSTGIMPLPYMPPSMVGCVMYRGFPLPVVDLSTDLGVKAESANAEGATQQIVVMNPPGGERFGLLVDELGEIVEVLTGRLTTLPPLVANRNTFADAAVVVDDTDDGELLMVLRADRIRAGISLPSTLAMAPREAAAG
jgi:chemotaxis signal transduction protein